MSHIEVAILLFGIVFGIQLTQFGYSFTIRAYAMENAELRQKLRDKEHEHENHD